MPKEPTTTTKTTWYLPCVLDDDEKRDYGRRLADLEHNKVTVETEKKAANDRFKERLSAIDVGIGQHVSAICDGFERRDVDCEWQYHWESFAKDLVRLDTGEVIEREAIGTEERQIGLADGESNG